MTDPLRSAPVAQEPLDLAPIKKRDAQATAGPWFFKVQTARRVEPDGSVMIGAVAPGHQIRARPPGGSFPSSDGEFIAHARADVPALIAEIERLRALASASASPQAKGEEWQPSDDATAELLAGLDELYPLPDDDKRCERAGRTAAVLKRWIQNEEVSLARAAMVIMKRDLEKESK